jgi:citrate synthase
MSVEAGKGLAGVVVADTRKSKVDGENGRLYYLGYSIFDLAENASFEEVTFLLLNNRLPTKPELDELTQIIIRDMAVDDTLLSVMKSFPKNAHPMGVLRTMISMLGVHDAEAEDNNPEANQRKALRILAKAPTLTAAWSRIRDGKAPVVPRSDLGIAANFMYMLKGEEPSETEVSAMDTYLILLADHGLNASTFTSRVVTSTDGDIYSAITAAIGALKGPKHGGANEAAMKMFMEIGGVDAVDEFFTKKVKGEGFKIMGIGHRVYKAPDPRGTILKERAKALADSTGNSKWYDVAEKLETLARADEYFIERQLFANVDYYSSIVLYTLGIKPDMMTPLFVMSRISGWAAHIIEQWADNRLIRPRANYVGTVDEAWIPIEKR